MQNASYVYQCYILSVFIGSDVCTLTSQSGYNWLLRMTTIGTIKLDMASQGNGPDIHIKPHRDILEDLHKQK